MNSRPQGVTYGRKPDCLAEELWPEKTRVYGVELSAAWLPETWWFHHTRLPVPESDEWSVFIGPYIKRECPDDVECDPKELATFLWTHGVTAWAFASTNDLMSNVSTKSGAYKEKIIDWFREVPTKPIRPMSRCKSVFTDPQDEMLFVDEFYS